MELLVLPVVGDESLCGLSRDELFQNATSRAITITEPKFTPKEAARINLANGIEAKAGVIDYVGFIIDGAAGHVEDDEECLVETSWLDYDIPFTQAAEIGTRRVINNHSTIGIVVTINGTIEEVKRPGYITTEKQAIGELKELGKPSAVLLSFTKPYSDETARLAEKTFESYGVSMFSVNCEQLKKEDIFYTLECVLKEFPVTEMDFHTPKWLEILPSTHWFKAQVIQAAGNVTQKVIHMKDVSEEPKQRHTGTIRSMNVKNMQTAGGRVGAQVDMDDSYYYQTLSDYVGLPIEGEYQLMQTLSSPANMWKEYEKVQNALTQVWLEGYGVVTPERSGIVLNELQVIGYGNKYGVKMKAEAPPISLIKAHTEIGVAPIMGDEQQAQDLIAYTRENTKESDDGVWSTNIFGKPIEQIMEDGIQAKVPQMTEDCQLKL